MGDAASEDGTANATRAEALDAEHRGLVALMLEIIERNAESASKAELSLLLRQLSSRTEHHFTAEEAYMRNTGYSKLDTHQIMHTQLLATLRKHVIEFEAGGAKLGVRLITFLKFWLMTHFNGMNNDIPRRASPIPASSLRPVRK